VNPDFLTRLRQTAATGIAPPRPSRAGSEPMQPLHEQLLASLQERQSLTEDVHANDTLYVRTVPPGPKGVTAGQNGRPGQEPVEHSARGQQAVHYEEPSKWKRSRTRFEAPQRRKGTIEEVLGEIEAVPKSPIDGTPLGPVPDLPVGSAHDERASDGRKPRNPALNTRCPICEGKGFLTRGPVTGFCGRCGGEGYVEDPSQRLEAHRTRVEEALAKEAAGEQELPLEIEQAETTTEGQAPPFVSMEEAAAGVSEYPQPVSLTYDLPTSVADLPAFCFVCGPAGTGKTFWAKALALGDEGVTLAATTGIAAVNLGEGTTINALLRFYDTQSLTDAFTGGWLEAQLKKQRGAGLRRIVLDETSMLSGDQLTILSRAIDNVNQDRGGDDAELGLILIGDFAQLPPVNEPFAFESAEWERYHAATYGLTTIRRQADREFISALQAVRRGEVAQALEFFAGRLEQTTHPHFDGTTVFAKNDAVDKYNQLRLDKVHGAPVEFGSSRWGKLRSEWGGDPQPRYKWGVPEALHLKIGALVMVLANRNVAEKGAPPEYLYVNGDLGTLVDVQTGTALVVLQRTGETVQVIPIQRENLIPLEVGRRKALRAEGHEERIALDGKHEVIGACSYMPLRLAWASTCHKSQGLSLTSVQLNLRDHFWTTGGMLYVGLSRCRTAEGLRIVGNLDGFRARCNTNTKVQPWL
jgi:ATP-dependent DNA helicase PIF1